MQYLSKDLAKKITIHWPLHRRREFRVVSWLHNHTNKSTHCQMDLHRQYFYSAHFPGIFATLYEHGQHRYEYRYKISDLTEEEFPPNSLSGEKYLGGCDYMKIDYDIITCNSEIAIIDARQAASPLGEEIVGSNECKSCKKPFPSEYDLLNHVARAKKCMPSYAAEIANFRAYIKRQKDASYAENPNSKSTTEGSPSHKIKKSGEYVCTICFAEFAWKKSMNRHIREVHSSSYDNIKCPDCQKTFSRQENMREHRRLAHAEIIDGHKCKICGEFFTTKQNFARHWREVHFPEETEPVQCPDCEATFKRSGKMKEHWDFWHSGKGEFFKCHICLKLFSKEDHFERHFREVHNLERSLTCKECPASFARKESLEKHNQGGQHWRHVYCDKCEQVLKFEYKRDRNRHFLSHGMREKCVPLGDEKPPAPEPWREGPNHISGVYCENPKECYFCKNNPWLKKTLEEKKRRISE